MMGIVMHTISYFRAAAAVVVIAAATSFAATASASPFFPFGPPNQGAPTMQAPADESDDATELPARFKRQIVDYRTDEAPGTIVIDTPTLPVSGPRQWPCDALRHRCWARGFIWSGTHTVTRKAEWPGWTPPPEMIKRRPTCRAYGGRPGQSARRARHVSGRLALPHPRHQ